MKYIDLHRHIEGSIRPETIAELLHAQGGSISPEDITKQMQVDGSERTLMDFIGKLGTKFMKQVVQSEVELERFGFEAVEDAFREGIIYLELRACPLPVVQANPTISIKEYIDSVRKGMLSAEKQFPILTNLIISIKRDDDVAENLQLVKEIIQGYENGTVAGADLSGDEARYPTRNFSQLFKLLSDAQVPFTIHAGEADGYQSIREAIELGAKRIGHATNLIHDKILMKGVQENGIGLECCITSNLHTHAIENIRKHPIHDFLNAGLKVTFNTDDPVTSAIKIKDEVKTLYDKFSMTTDDIAQMIENAIDISFMNSAQRLQFLLLKSQ